MKRQTLCGFAADSRGAGYRYRRNGVRKSPDRTLHFAGVRRLESGRLADSKRRGQRAGDFHDTNMLGSRNQDREYAA